ncbi:MAG: hypothetical protein D6720_04960, partial [Gammaproteobacteria bacterium]
MRLALVLGVLLVAVVPPGDTAPSGAAWAQYLERVLGLTGERIAPRRGQGPPFPRIGAHLLGNHAQFADPLLLKRLGRYSDLTVLNLYPGWEERHRMPLTELVRRIRAENPDALVRYLP